MTQGTGGEGPSAGSDRRNIAQREEQLEQAERELAKREQIALKNEQAHIQRRLKLAEREREVAAVEADLMRREQRLYTESKWHPGAGQAGLINVGDGSYASQEVAQEERLAALAAREASLRARQVALEARLETMRDEADKFRGYEAVLKSRTETVSRRRRENEEFSGLFRGEALAEPAPRSEPAVPLTRPAAAPPAVPLTQLAAAPQPAAAGPATPAPPAASPPLVEEAIPLSATAPARPGPPTNAREAAGPLPPPPAVPPAASPAPPPARPAATSPAPPPAKPAAAADPAEPVLKPPFRPPVAPTRTPTSEHPPFASPATREHQRVELKSEVSFESETNFYVGWSGDVSAGGIFIATHDLLEKGTQIRLQFKLPGGRRVTALGEVMWLREYNHLVPDQTPGMGIRFHGLEQSDSRAVNEFITRRDPIFFDDEEL